MLKEARRFDSGVRSFTPEELVARTRALVSDWEYEAVSVGYPGRVGPQGPIAEPGNLAGGGWDSTSRRLGRPVRIVNDAAMQALGGHEGGRMLFLGLGTGLGSALVVEHVIVPLELGSLRLRGDEDLFKRLGKKGLERRRRKGLGGSGASTSSSTSATRSSPTTSSSAAATPNASANSRNTPARRQRRAFSGGFRLWEEDVEPHDRPHSPRLARRQLKKKKKKKKIEYLI